MKRSFSLLPLLCLASAAAAKPASIVGDWRFAEESCASAIRIGAMSLSSEDVSCRFSSVRREGSRVTWKGICDDAEGSSAQTVTATEADGRLTIRYIPGGNGLADLIRCAK